MTQVKITNKSSLPKNTKGGPLVPKKVEDFKDNSELLDKLAYAVQEDFPVLLIGETGTGKTSAIRYMAHKTNNNFRRLNLNGQTTVDEFVGKIMINDKGTYWVDGVLTEALREGHWLVLDELNSALPEVLFVLQSLLDDDKYIVLSDKEDKEIVRPHKNFRLFATMNPSDSYVGTKDMNKALMSRFSMVLEVGYPNKIDEVDILVTRTNIKQKEAKVLVEVADQLRGSYFEDEMDFVMSTRDLIAWAKHNHFFNDWFKSADATFLNKCNPDDKQCIQKILKLNFKETLGEIKTVSDIQEIIIERSRGNNPCDIKIGEDIRLFNSETTIICAGSVIRPLFVNDTHASGNNLLALEVMEGGTGQVNENGDTEVAKGTKCTVLIDDLLGAKPQKVNV